MVCQHQETMSKIVVLFYFIYILREILLQTVKRITGGSLVISLSKLARII